MLCQNCGKEEVNFKYTQVVNGVKKEIVLCDKCAKELGLESLDFNIPINFSSFLGNFFDELEDTSVFPTLAKKEELKCENCGNTYSDFINSGKFGCPNCYPTFELAVDSLLKNLHGTSSHIGRKSKKAGIAAPNIRNETPIKVKPKVKETNKNSDQVKVLDLEKQLNIAIKEERYEDAAKLRDEIKKINENNK